jgi:hypothetical protein
MNKKLFLSLLLLFSIQSLFAQTQDGHLRGTWTPWTTVYSEQPDLKVEISFNMSQCNKYGLIGYSFWRIRSNFNKPMAYVKFDFDAIACDGKVKNTLINYKLDKPGITNDLGDWVMAYEVQRIGTGKMTDYARPIRKN